MTNVYQVTFINGTTKVISSNNSKVTSEKLLKKMKKADSLVSNIHYLFTIEINDDVMFDMCMLEDKFVCFVSGGYFASDAYLEQGNCNGVSGSSFGIITHDDNQLYKEDKSKIRPLTSKMLIKHFTKHFKSYSNDFIKAMKDYFNLKAKMKYQALQTKKVIIVQHIGNNKFQAFRIDESKENIKDYIDCETIGIYQDNHSIKLKHHFDEEWLNNNLIRVQ